MTVGRASLPLKIAPNLRVKRAIGLLKACLLPEENRDKRSPERLRRFWKGRPWKEKNAAGARFVLGFPEAVGANLSLQMWLSLLRSNRDDGVFASEDLEVFSGLSLPLMTTREQFLAGQGE